MALASVFRKAEVGSASFPGVWTPASQEYPGFRDALGTAEAHAPWAAQLRAHCGQGSGHKANSWLCPETASGRTLEFGNAPGQKPLRMILSAQPRFSSHWNNENQDANSKDSRDDCRLCAPPLRVLNSLQILTYLLLMETLMWG